MNAPIRLAPPTAAPVSTRLAVPGMRCQGCIATLEREVPRQSGITSARVDFTARQLIVGHAPTLTPPELVAAIARCGFEARPLSDPLAAPTAEGVAAGPGAGAARGSDPELARLLRALGVAAFAAMNIMLLSVSVWSGADGSSRDLFHWLSALIGVPAVAYAGRPFFASAWQAVRAGRTNMDVPISIGVLLTTAMSLFETARGGPHAWFDGAVMLLAFLLAGRVLDQRMRTRAALGAAALMEASAPGAMVLAPDGTTGWRDARALAPGMVMQVAAGERLAADGIVATGTGAIDAALLTGEAALQPMGPGDRVLAGMLNAGAVLTVTVTKAGEDRVIAGLARAMVDAGQARSRYVRFADRAARLYAPAVHALALLAALGWWWTGAGVHQSLLIAVAVLLITCPCALGLAVPVAQVVAAGTMQREGLLVKDGSALERLAEVDAVMLDKTGTLTMGQPVPDAADLAALGPDGRSVALALAQASRHPLSRGLASALAQAGTRPARLNAVREVPGVGMQGSGPDGPVTLGQQDGALAPAPVLRTTSADRPAVTLTRPGAPPVPVRFADALRPDADVALARLAAQGLSASILSGDRARPVAAIAARLGLPALAAVGPAAKRDAIVAAQAAGARVLMVGDGINDGPALAAAHASIAPSSASDVGQQAADLVFVRDSLLAIPRAVAIARRTQVIVRQNFALAIAYNVLAVPLAVLGHVTPLVAALAMSGSSLVVILNALRLARA